MEYFDRFVSNSVAGTGNQLCYDTCGERWRGRVFYRVCRSGEWEYSLLFSNTIDSTYGDGSLCRKNRVCEGWRLCRARLGAAAAPPHCGSFTELTFGGEREKQVAPGELFASDPVRLLLREGEYLCLETEVEGPCIPYHAELRIPAFVLREGAWCPDVRMPVASMVGIARRAVRIGYWGDSITQGIGTEPDSYTHWTAEFARLAGDRFAHWNLGLGFGRAEDAASCGAWFSKARHNDTVLVCFGVNDLLQGREEEQIKQDLRTAVRALKAEGLRVVVQTLPPFDYKGELIGRWMRVCAFILEELAGEADAVFDCRPCLWESPERPQVAAYGGHPNAEGCKRWAQALYETLQAKPELWERP